MTPIQQTRRSGSAGGAGVEQVLLAAPRSFCAGVEMAIKALAWMVRLSEPPVYCYHQIIHNRAVVERFERAGVVFVDHVDEIPHDAPVMLSAHGSAPEVVEAARSRSSVVVDAVCPLVRKVHHEIRRRSDAGDIVVYAGHPHHDEAVGSVAVAPRAVRLVQGPEDVAALGPVDGPVAFMAQTTLAVDDWEATLAETRNRFGDDVWLPPRHDVCFATTNRQAAVRAIATRCDALVVIGSANSSNTLALARVAEGAGAGDVLRVDGPEELPAGLCGTVGVTAGASAPDGVVEEVVAALAPRGGVETVTVTAEEEYFPPPREVRDLLRADGAAHLLDADRTVSASEVLDTLPDVSAPDVSTPDVSPADARSGARADERPGDVTTASGTEADALHHLKAYASWTDEQMVRVVDEEVDDRWLRRAVHYHLGFVDDLEEPGTGAGLERPEARRSGGKKLRAALVVLSYLTHRARADALVPHGTADPDPVRPVAAAVELLHNWSLIHDDIEDGDRTRRGRAALWTLCGIPQAINVGDCVQALATLSLTRLSSRGVPDHTVEVLVEEQARTAARLTVGQARDLTFETVTDVSSDEYLEMIEGKTGALMRYCTFAGALAAGAAAEDAARFGAFGRHLGLSFQIRDDILGIWGSAADTGKPTGSDIVRRKKTLPVLLAFEHATGDDRIRLGKYYAPGSGEPTPADAGEIRRILDDCGVQEKAQEQARRHRDAGLTALSPLVVPQTPGTTPPLHGDAGRDADAGDADPGSALRTLARFVTERHR